MCRECERIGNSMKRGPGVQVIKFQEALFDNRPWNFLPTSPGSKTSKSSKTSPKPPVLKPSRGEAAKPWFVPMADPIAAVWRSWNTTSLCIIIIISYNYQIIIKVTYQIISYHIYIQQILDSMSMLCFDSPVKPWPGSSRPTTLRGQTFLELGLVWPLQICVTSSFLAATLCHRFSFRKRFKQNSTTTTTIKPLSHDQSRAKLSSEFTERSFGSSVIMHSY